MPLLYIHYTRHDLVICTFLHRWLTSPQRALLALFKHATSFISILRRRSASSGEAFWSFPKLLALISHQDASLFNCIPSGQVAKKKRAEKYPSIRWRREMKKWGGGLPHMVIDSRTCLYHFISSAAKEKKKDENYKKHSGSCRSLIYILHLNKSKVEKKEKTGLPIVLPADCAQHWQTTEMYKRQPITTQKRLMCI